MILYIRSTCALTAATTDSQLPVLTVDLCRWTAAHLKEKLPISMMATFCGWTIPTLCLYRPYQSLRKGLSSYIYNHIVYNSAWKVIKSQTFSDGFSMTIFPSRWMPTGHLEWYRLCQSSPSIHTSYQLWQKKAMKLGTLSTLAL